MLSYHYFAPAELQAVQGQLYAPPAEFEMPVTMF